MILINLLPPELRRKETPKLVLPEIPVKKTLMVLAAAVLALQLLLSIVAVFYATRFKIVQHETARLSAKMEGVRQAKTKTSAAAKKMQDIRMLTEKKFYWALLLNEISVTATRGIWLRSLSVEEMVVEKPSKKDAASKDKKPAEKKKKDAKAAVAKKLETEKYKVLKLEGSCGGGSGQETALIGKYLKSLRESTYFKALFGSNIDLSGMKQRKMGEVDVFDFTIYCKFEKDKA